MYEAARRILEYTNGMDLDQYLQSDLHQAAIERQFEILGEGARRLSDSFKLAHPEIPWKQIIGQRHIIAHDYDKVSHVQIWKTITSFLPSLLKSVESLIPPVPPDNPETKF